MIEKVKLILPNIKLKDSFYKRAFNVCLSLFEDKSKIDLQVYLDFEITFNNDDIIFLEPKNFILEGFEHVVCIHGYDIPPIQNFTKIKEGHFFWINRDFQITTPDGKYNEILTPGNQAHYFNKALPNEVAAFGYFPYLDLSRDQRLRPINPLGHRNSGIPLSYKERSNFDKVIIILGGSTAQGVHVNYEETFGFQLENLLNNLSGLKYNYKVLNFAVSGHIVTDEFITFFSFCDHFNPDLVITFDGLNDLFNGCVNDPYLINEWMYAYRYQNEERAQFFNGDNNSLEESEIKRNLKVKNEMNIVINSYLFRLKQLHTYFKGRNIPSIACLQPHLFSKKELSIEEQEFLEKTEKNQDKSDVSVIYKLEILPKLIEKTSKKFSELPFKTLDFHKLFKVFGHEITLFRDRVHFNPDGEKIVADNLIDHVKKTMEI